jgi:hypothetical protein
MKLGGIIYLHDISQSRVLGATRKQLDISRKMLGERADRSVILVTTKWAEVTPELGNRREDELKTTYWKEMVDSGSRVERFEDTSASAWKIVDMILDVYVEENHPIHIQRELVDFSRRIPETEAGKTLRHTFEELLQMQYKMAEGLKAEADDPDTRAKLEENEDRIRQTIRQIKDLEISIPRRIMNFFHLMVSRLFQ